MRLALDAMGGDYAPTEVVRGAVLFAREHPQHEVILVGHERRIHDVLRAELAAPGHIIVHHASEVVEMGEHPGAAIRTAVAEGRLFGAGLRDLVGRHALRGPELAAFVLHDVLERTLADTGRTLGCDARTAKRRLLAARTRLELADDADPTVIGQWLVTELIAPPTRALQLRLFRKVDANEQGTAEAEDDRQARLAVEEGESRAQAGDGPRQA